jgi:putative endonuclease
MADPRHTLGLDGEEATAAWLSGAGWRVLARRQRSAFGGEVDLIALDPDGVLVAVEVRVRRSVRSGGPDESVDALKVARLHRTLVAFARASREPRCGLRIDLVAVEPAPGRRGAWRLRRVPGIGRSA